MNRPLIATLMTLALLTGCTMAPKYVRPAMPVPETWPDSAHASAAPPGIPAPAELQWKDFFADQRLQSLIAMALENNRDLRVATLNVQKAQALYRIQRSELFPTAGIQATGDKYRMPSSMAAQAPEGVYEQDTVQVGVASWELDLFGRIRSLKNKALQQYFSTDQARLAARISLVAAVADAYLALAADREQLALAQSTVEAQQASVDLIRSSREAGIASDLDLSQAQSQVDAARVGVSTYEGLVATDQNALSLLVGAQVPPGLMPLPLDEAGEVKDISAGVSSEILLKRPDIVAAECQLKAANANIGAARAAFFPRITLTAGIGSMSTELSGLFDSGTRAWTFAPQIVAPIFAGGSLLANLKGAKVDRDISVAQYEKSIQSAFREVSDALALRTTLREKQEAQRALVASLDQSYRLSDLRYQAGLDGYLGVLVNQRALYVAQRGLVAIRLEQEVNRVTLYKALGGGT